MTASQTPCATSNEVARPTESDVPPVGGWGLWPTFRHTESIKETSEMRDDLIFLLLNSVPRWLRGRLYLRICRRQMERWHPRLRTDPNWQSRWSESPPNQ